MKYSMWIDNVQEAREKVWRSRWLSQVWLTRTVLSPLTQDSFCLLRCPDLTPPLTFLPKFVLIIILNALEMALYSAGCGYAEPCDRGVAYDPSVHSVRTSQDPLVVLKGASCDTERSAIHENSRCNRSSMMSSTMSSNNILELTGLRWPTKDIRPKVKELNCMSWMRDDFVIVLFTGNFILKLSEGTGVWSWMTMKA